MSEDTPKKCSFCNFTDVRNQKVYEGDKVYAIVSIDPINKYHVLVIPKEHYTSLVSIPENVLTEMIIAVQQLSTAVRKASACDAVAHVTEDEVKNNGYNLVKHFKFHIIPRYEKDLHLIDYSPMRIKVSDGELTELANEIKNVLRNSN